ncbi:MAG: DUF1559 domain-containing protein [Planctomycetes bacterium]|nr:DUF1559 domain-containing protein [Planctomycetota bacterium]
MEHSSYGKPVKMSGSVSRGFTLMELLVVVVIVAVLASLIIGCVTIVRDAAVRVACKNNLRQASTAMLMYAGESRRLLPVIAIGSSGWWDMVIWNEVAVLPYTNPESKWDPKTSGSAVGGGAGLICPVLVCPAVSARSGYANTYKDARISTQVNSAVFSLTSNVPLSSVRSDGIMLFEKWSEAEIFGRSKAASFGYGNGYYFPAHRRLKREKFGSVYAKQGEDATYACFDGSVSTGKWDVSPATGLCSLDTTLPWN